MTTHQPLAVGLIGGGRMGSFRAETLARRFPGVRLAAVADPAPDAANQRADHLGRPTACTGIGELLADPRIEAVVISTPARTHADLVVAAARDAGVPLQVGFNRRHDRGFRAAHDKIAAGEIGTPSTSKRKEIICQDILSWRAGSLCVRWNLGAS
jgi:myo-inositol 2-dehydrogenase/D-chiro-inositol 1-dehydrogenase